MAQPLTRESVAPDRIACNALILADRIYKDEDSGKWIICGVFSSIYAESFPCLHDRLEVFFQVTNIGPQPVDLRLSFETSDGDILMEYGGPIACESPLAVIERKLVLRNVPFVGTGKFWMCLKSNGEILTQAPLHIIEVEMETDEPTDEPDNPSEPDGQQG